MKLLEKLLEESKPENSPANEQAVRQARALREQLHGKDYKPKTKYRLKPALGGDVTTLLPRNK